MISIAVYFTSCLYVDSPFKLNKVVYTISKCDVFSSLESGFGPNCFTYFQLKFLKFQACNGKSPCKLQRRNYFLETEIETLLQVYLEYCRRLWVQGRWGGWGLNASVENGNCRIPVSFPIVISYGLKLSNGIRMFVDCYDSLWFRI